MLDIKGFFTRPRRPNCKLIGLILGIAVSYLFCPSFLGMRTPIVSWFANQDHLPIIIICGLVGYIVGGIIGHFLYRH